MRCVDAWSAAHPALPLQLSAIRNPSAAVVKAPRLQRPTVCQLCLMQDFAGSDDARVLMDSEHRWSVNLNGHPLLLDYSHGTASSKPTGGPGDASAADWICDMCSAVNFAR